MSDCPCGSGLAYEACCGPIISGAKSAETAEALMRSRYSAYVKREYKHLKDSLSGKQRSDYSEEETKKWAEKSEWQSLEIHETHKGGPDDDEGAVEFTAKFRSDDEDHEHREVAIFSREENKWVYAGQLEGPGETYVREEPKIGRNDPCPCGSGKKYKKCCGAAA
jgi:SEC-C motif-containing protein